MAQKTKVILTDDLDGSEATQTITFAYQGTSYEQQLRAAVPARDADVDLLGLEAGPA